MTRYVVQHEFDHEPTYVVDTLEDATIATYENPLPAKVRISKAEELCEELNKNDPPVAILGKIRKVKRARVSLWDERDFIIVQDISEDVADRLVEGYNKFLQSESEAKNADDWLRECHS